MIKSIKPVAFLRLFCILMSLFFLLPAIAEDLPADRIDPAGESQLTAAGSADAENDPVTGTDPLTEEHPAAEGDDPIEADDPLTGENPAVGDDPIEADDPLTEEAPAAGDDPIEANDPLTEEAPAAEGDDPIEANDPLTGENPAAGDDPIEADDPLTEEALAAEGDDPIEADDPLTEEAPAAEDDPATAVEPAVGRIPWDTDIMPYAPHQESYLPDQAGYHDSTLDIRIETMRKDDTNIMVVRVKIADPTQLRCTTSNGKLSSRSKAPVAAMAKRVGAVLAINGDYYNYHTDGLVIRNGSHFREKPNKGRDTLIIDDKGDFTILAPTSREAYETFDGVIIHAFCFGPGLVINHEPLTDLSTVMLDVGKTKKTQRIAIGQDAPLSYLIIATEGPENANSIGFDLLQMAALCKELGCINAYNLDGGSSSTIVLNNEKINALSSKKIRPVGDCIFFATLEP